MKINVLYFGFIILLFNSCLEKDQRQEVWIYTSLYKDTISDMTPTLEKKFPNIKIQWFQAGSEDIASKVNTELLAGIPKADLLISSERFWYQELSDNKKLHTFKPQNYDKIHDSIKNPELTFQIASIPVMVIAYNSDVIKENEAPKSFSELINPKFKDKINGGSPLSSGTNFTTMSALQYKYGWDFFKKLKANNALLEGGNSAVLRRIQSNERPIGWVLLENVLRFQNDDKRIQIIYPDDGAITQFNTLGIIKKETDRKNCEALANWFLSEEGQEYMIKSYMYSVLKNFKSPDGALAYEKLVEKSFPWKIDVIKEIVSKRSELKDEFSSIMFK